MIRTQLSVFLGVVVNPKTHEPCYVVKRNGTWRTVDIFLATAGAYESIGSGYLNDDTEWSKPTKITGLPRSHTPSGVKIKGGGFGTCLYTGLVLLASSGAEQFYDLGLRSGTYGRGLGICSADDGRSESASAWWDSAYDRDLTEREEGDAESDDEPQDIEEEDVDLFSLVSSRVQQKIIDAVSEILNSGHIDGYVHAITRLEGTVSKPDPDYQGTEALTADVYKLKSAKEHHLIPIWDVLEGQWHVDPMLQWGRTPFGPDRLDYVDVEALLALNVSQEGPLQVARLADAARQMGVDDDRIKAMMLSAQYGVDPSLELVHAFARARVLEPEVLEPGAGGPTGEAADPAAWAEYGAAQAAALERAHGRAPESLRMNPPRRNPGTPTRAERRLLDEREEEVTALRDELGWNDLADLP